MQKVLALFERYQKTKKLLLTNVQTVLSSLAAEHSQVGTKRSSEEIGDDYVNVQAAKRARLSQSIAK